MLSFITPKEEFNGIFIYLTTNTSDIYL